MDFNTKHIKMRLSIYEAQTLRSLCRARAQKLERQGQRKAFKPAPGKQDVNKLQIMQLQSLHDQLDKAIDSAVANK